MSLNLIFYKYKIIEEEVKKESQSTIQFGNNGSDISLLRLSNLNSNSSENSTFDENEAFCIGEFMEGLRHGQAELTLQ